MALASAGAFAPNTAFVSNPLMPASHGIDRIVNLDNAVAQAGKVSVFLSRLKTPSFEEPWLK